MTRRIAICIPFNKSFLKETLELYDHLNKKFGLSFMKNKLCRPHINLYSGSTNKIEKLKKKIKKIKVSKKKRKVFYLGIGTFQNDKTTFYLRFSIEKIFLDLRKKIADSGCWLNIDKTSLNQMWIPKSSIIHNELSIKNKSYIKIVNFINSWKFSKKKFYIEEISIIDFTETEHEITSFKI